MKEFNNLVRKYISEWFRSLILKGVTLSLILTSGSFFEMLCAQESVTQIIILKGVVRDAHTRNPVNAAQIQSLFSANSAVTDSLGQFQISLLNNEEVVSVTGYDYNVRQISVRGRAFLEIDLYPNTFKNYFQKVNGLGGSKEKLTTVQAIAYGADAKNGFTVSADEMIHNNLNGAVRSISRSAVAGMGAVMYLRGLNSLNANAQPLFVVDGVLWHTKPEQGSVHYGYQPNPLDVIDVNDIDGITILKNGTAIYGSKAANGVVLIKTKRAKSTVTKIDVNVTSGITTEPRTIPVMNASEHLTYVSEMLKTSGMTKEQIDQLPYLNDDQARSNYLRYHNNTDWTSQVYNNGTSNDYSINVNGGDDKALYYLSLGYTQNRGVVQPSGMDRYNVRLNADVNLFENASLAVNIGFSRIDRDMIDDGVNPVSSPSWIAQIKSPVLYPFNYTSLGTPTEDFEYYDIFGVSNPGGIIHFSNNTFKKNSFNISLHPEFRINEKFRISEHFDYNLYKTNEDYYRPYLFASPLMLEGKGISENARSSQIVRSNSMYSDTRADYDLTIDNHKFDIFAGIRFMMNAFRTDYVEGHNSYSNSVVNLPANFKFLRTDGVNDLYKSLSYYTNVSYSLDNKYFVDMALSVDGSSRFGRETKGGFRLFGHSWGVFPSLSAAWLMSSESFMQSAKTIDLLKLRAGLSLTGNDDVPDYLNNVYFTSVRFKDGANGALLNMLENPQIQWESSFKADLGADLILFNDRLSVSADMFYTNTYNLLNMHQLPYVAGQPFYWGNGGSLQNLGGELSLNWKVMNRRNFSWETNLNIGRYKNKITSLPENLFNKINFEKGAYTTNIFNAEILTAVGHSAGVFYGYKTTGVFATEVEATAAGLKIQNNDGSFSDFEAGDMIFVDMPDANGVKDGIIDEHDKQIIGNPNPDLYGSFLNTITYKSFTVSALFAGSLGNDVYNYPRSILESGLDFSNQSSSVLSRWIGEGHVTSQPKAITGDPMGNARFSDRWIEDGSFLRLKNVTLSYDLKLPNNNFLDKVNVWVAVNNVFVLTEYLGPDPEFAAGNSVLYQGIDNGLLPQSRSFFAGLKINL
ncbi:MAG: SusC/RagA family TonB-linked outer membrane protein [Paludibacteraceae bacterium]|nr:SusC/RagA family TonB-linked outer membrane protein [Paludibacteraceae bacterium]